MAILKTICIKGLKFFSPCFLLVAFPCALFVRLFSKSNSENPRLVWGPVPIINNSHWSKALKQAGFLTETYTTDFFTAINARHDWDRMVNEDLKKIPAALRPYFAFFISLLRYDVFFFPFSGYFLGNTALWRFESILFKIAGKKTVVIPYGGDAYDYAKTKSTSLAHCLFSSYPDLAKKGPQISKKVAYWRKNADVIIPGWIGFDGIGRWDVLVGSQLHIDTNDWKAAEKYSTANGVNDIVRVVHASNHRGLKGTEFIIDAIKRLQDEGIKVELNLIEGKQNSEVKRILREETDILLEQMIFSGHGLNAVEGMASGACVISNLEDENYTLPVRRWSYFKECPIVSACPENIEDRLRALISNPELRQNLGQAGRSYAEKYHGYPAAQHLFKEVIKYLYGRRDTLIDLYHPILGEYNKTSPYIQHPLIDNKIPAEYTEGK